MIMWAPARGGGRGLFCAKDDPGQQFMCFGDRVGFTGSSRIHLTCCPSWCLSANLIES